MPLAFTQRILQLTCLPLFLLCSNAQAAQEVVINASSLELSVQVEAFQQFGETGQATGLLRRALKRLSPENRQKAQKLFATRIDIDPVRLSEFLYTPQGETVLHELGEILQSEAGLSGSMGLRSALFQAAQDSEEGLTIANVLKHVPGDRIRLNFARIKQLAEAWTGLPQEPSFPEPKLVTDAPDFSLQDRLHLEFQGEYAWELLSAGLQTAAGDIADLYIPQGLRRANPAANPTDIGQRPMVVISHGMGGDRSSFRYLAEHLASHGFVVMVPQHDLAALSRGRGEAFAPAVIQADALLQEDWAQKLLPEDFAQRPLAVTRLLDSLEQRQRSDARLSQRIDFDRIGVLGQSFGGYSSLALGGAQIDLEGLAQHCPADVAAFNPSLVLQCVALGLNAEQTNYRDPRVKAIAAFNPVSSAIFGPQGIAKIKVPTLLLAGSKDVVTPPRDEQIPAFQWLTNQHRYLLWMDGGSHFSVIQDSEEGSASDMSHASSVEQLKSLTELSPKMMGEHHEQAQAYAKVSSLAFFQTHLSKQTPYAKFLSPEFAAWLSEGKALPLRLSQEPESLSL